MHRKHVDKSPSFVLEALGSMDEPMGQYAIGNEDSQHTSCPWQNLHESLIHNHHVWYRIYCCVTLGLVISSLTILSKTVVLQIWCCTYTVLLNITHVSKEYIAAPLKHIQEVSQVHNILVQARMAIQEGKLNMHPLEQ